MNYLFNKVTAIWVIWFALVASVQNGDQIKNQGYVEQTGHAIDEDTFNG